MKNLLADASTVTGWFTVGRCDNSGPNCVQCAVIDGQIGIRDSKNPTGPALMFTPDEWAVFVAGVRAGEADYSGA